MKKRLAWSLIILLLLILTSCEPVTSTSPPISESPADSISESSNTPSQSSEIPSEQIQTPSAPELVGVTKEDVDFLSLEQWELLEKGYQYIYPFEISAGYFYDDDLQENAPEKKVNGLTYYKYVGTRYGSWNDFYNDMVTVFTPQYFTELNAQDYGELGSVDTYINLSGDLFYKSGNRGANPTYIPELDRYELIEANDQRIIFNLIAYYLSYSDVGSDSVTPESMSRCPIVLKKTQNGWRISKMTLPY